MAHALTLLVFSACLGACAPGIPEIPPPASSVTRREALAASRAYTSMIWRGSLRNVRHGTDGDGIRTDTPDASAAGDDAGAWWKPGMRSIGMPYKWGGFDTPRQFSERLKADAANGGAPAAAGDMGTPEKQAAGDAAVSRFAAGVDCSVFVSRCWRLDRPFSTRELPALCKKKPGIPMRQGCRGRPSTPRQRRRTFTCRELQRLYVHMEHLPLEGGAKFLQRQNERGTVHFGTMLEVVRKILGLVGKILQHGSSGRLPVKQQACFFRFSHNFHLDLLAYGQLGAEGKFQRIVTAESDGASPS